VRIVEVRAVHPHAPEAPTDWRGWLGQILVAVDTSDGLTGYGVGGGGTAGVHVVRTVLRDALVGQDPSDVEGLWTNMYRRTLPFGRKGLAIMAISGVDLALWDLRGKRRGKPIAELLGGSVGQPIPAYVTVATFDELEMWQPQNLRAVKLHVEKLDAHVHPDRLVELVRRVRNALRPETQLMADAFMSWDVSSTLGIAQRIAQYNVTWLEEPLPPDDLQGYAQLTRQCPIPIAGGEHEFTAMTFKDLMERHLHDVFQPDVCWCGGLSQPVKIYEIGRRYGFRVCPHRGAEIWALHAISALDPESLAESGRPWMTWVEGQPPVEEGTVRLGSAPGFGVTFDESLWQTG
jgi:L-alanine-DL-glutamate epimerase-like enolase superfamily enzyme